MKRMKVIQTHVAHHSVGDKVYVRTGKGRSETPASWGHVTDVEWNGLSGFVYTMTMGDGEVRRIAQGNLYTHHKWRGGTFTEYGEEDIVG